MLLRVELKIVKAWLAKWFRGTTVTTKHLMASHKMPNLLAKFKWKCQHSIKCPEWGGHAGTEDRHLTLLIDLFSPCT